MTIDTDVCLPRATSEAEYIRSILSSCKLAVREGRTLTRSMIAAVQPLTIDGREICTDTVLAEFVEYATADRMVRETTTMTIKKAAFGAFESSMTPIPKYCFTDVFDLKAVLVHSISRFTLDDILTAVEKEYRWPYTYDRIGFYADWKKSIADRIRNHVKPGKARFLTIAAKLPGYLFPGPPRIVQSQRKAFADCMLRAVGQHHENGIYHDRISERTIFFPIPCQPQFLSNYSGVVSPMLSDYIPHELMTDEAIVNYGPQYRDVYCLALICYRIMTGEKLDGKRFTLESPRPLGMVLREIVRSTGYALHLKGFNDVFRSLGATIMAVKKIASLIPMLFAGDNFVAWRKINKATGGLWRSIPVVGSLCDIVVPTHIARALRYVLDKPWLLTCRFQKMPSSVRSPSHGPEITLLTDAFKVRRPLRFPRFESALNVGNSESVKKRKAFGSIMESGLSIKRAYRLMVDKRKTLLFSSAALIMMALISTVIYNRQKAAVAGATATPTAATATPVTTHLPVAEKTPVVKNAAIVTTASFATDTPPMNEASGLVLTPLTTRVHRDSVTVKPSPSTESSVMAVKTAVTGNISIVKKSATVPKKKAPMTNIGKKRGAAKTVAGKKSTVAAGKSTSKSSRQSGKRSSPESEPKITLVPKGFLYPVQGYRDVYVVTGLIDSCNPGNLYYSFGERKDTVTISELATASRNLYMAHRSSTGFGAIETIRLCRSGKCDRTMYYTARGVSGIGKPVYVRPGDIISSDRSRIREFTGAMRSLLAK